MKRLSETYIREDPQRTSIPESDKVQQIEEFANNKAEIIKAWTEISDHPEATDMSSDVGSAFTKEDLDEEMSAAYEAIGEKGIIYCSFEHSFWIRYKGKLIRVM